MTSQTKLDKRKDPTEKKNSQNAKRTLKTLNKQRVHKKAKLDSLDRQESEWIKKFRICGVRTNRILLDFCLPHRLENRIDVQW